MKLPGLIGRRGRLASWGLVAASMAAVLLWVGCGSTFRPVPNPILGPGGDPQLRSYALVLNQSTVPGNPGVASQIDVSGDTNVGDQPVGRTPIQAAILSLEAFVVNQADDSVTAYFPTSASPINTVLVPAGSMPSFVLPLVPPGVATTSAISVVTLNTSAAGTGYAVGDELTVVQTGASGGIVQVTNINTINGAVAGVEIVAQGSGYSVANGLATTGGHGTGAQVNITAVGFIGGRQYVANFGNGTVSVIDSTQVPPAVIANPALQVSTETTRQPVAIAPSADGSQAFVVNRNTNEVSVIATGSSTVVTAPNSSPPTPFRIAVGTSPVAAVTNPVAASSPTLGLIYVLNGGNGTTNGTISIITPNATATSGVVTGSVNLPASLPSTDPCMTTTAPPGPCAPMTFDGHLLRLYVANGDSTVSIFDASTATLTLLATLPATKFSNPRAIAVLPDGSKAYVVNTGDTTGACGVTVITAATITAATPSVKCISVGASPVWIAASVDGTKVFVPHQGSTPGTTIIQTVNDTVVTDSPAPLNTLPVFVTTSGTV